MPTWSQPERPEGTATGDAQPASSEPQNPAQKQQQVQQMMSNVTKTLGDIRRAVIRKIGN
mgnify:CR=1 FL=1